MSYQTAEIQHKIRFSGRITSVQVKSTVWRYITDNRTHREIGYNVFLHGSFWDDGDAKTDVELDFSVAISETQMMKLRLRIGDVISGTAWTEMYKCGQSPAREWIPIMMTAFWMILLPKAGDWTTEFSLLFLF